MDSIQPQPGHDVTGLLLAWRAVHVMTETAKLVIRNYYGRFAGHSYFSGCSTGGQQALTRGLATLCIGGGTGAAVVVERSAADGP